MSMHDIHNSSQLIYLSVSIWSARKLDRSVTADLNQEKNAASNASRVNKYLMANADAQLKDITRIGREARDLLEKRTLPWDDAGNRLVSNAELFPLLADLNEIEKRFSAAVESFLVEYPELCKQSQAALGDMSDANDYPSVEQVRQKFAMRTSLQPMPEGYGDVRLGLSPDQIQALNAQYAEQVKDQFEQAQARAFERLQENVERMVDRLSLTEDGKNKQFTYTLVENVRETVQLMAGLNVFNTPELAALHADIEAKLCKYDVKDLRNSISAASSTRAAAESILQRMKAFGA